MEEMNKDKNEKFWTKITSIQIACIASVDMGYKGFTYAKIIRK